jgi:acyl CoA:acetate/3-ketoacid CoA transferase beta subunit
VANIDLTILGAMEVSENGDIMENSGKMVKEWAAPWI